MKKIYLFPLLFVAIGMFAQNGKTSNISADNNIRVAFISDAHIQDVVGHPELVRSQEAQVQSTRLFNENYFALLAALDDCARRGINIVAMPGDLTDDGQIVAEQCVRKILKSYSDKYGMQFFVTVGNHDPQSPVSYERTKTDYLGDDGSQVTISSDATSGAQIIREDLRGSGYFGLTECYADFGFMPQESFKLWATPYSSYDADNYSFEQAKKECIIEQRKYKLGNGMDYDATYVVEPVEGLWLLAIDGAVHFQKRNGEYKSSALGYNNWQPARNHVLAWIKTIATAAKQKNKTLIAFCHFPAADFNDGADKYISKCWGEEKFDIKRTPSKEITDAIREAGINVHFGGHLHVNDTGISGDFLVNVQVPSLAMCVPGYKILTINDPQHMDVETVTLTEVPNFNSLFGRYQKEYDHDIALGKAPIWSIEALKSKNYQEFCNWHFRDVTRVRFIPRLIPEVLRQQITDRNGKEILALIAPNATAEESMEEWTGFDMLHDLFRLRYSGELVRGMIPQTRLNQYNKIFDAANAADTSPLIEQIRGIGEMFGCCLNEEPSINFTIDLEQKKVTAR